MTARPGTLTPARPAAGASAPPHPVAVGRLSGPAPVAGGGPSVLQGPATPAPRTLLQVFDATRRASPHNVALEDATGSLTYEELWERAGALADELAVLGIGVGDRVGIRVPSGTTGLYVAVLGVLRSGAAYVPADAADPDERAALVFAEADVAAVVGPEGVRLRGRGHGRPGPPGLDDECWVIFTSGSTGIPKGVAVRHRSAAAFVDAEAGFLRVVETDRVLGGLSVAFDASCEEMWLAWRNGAALVACPRSVVRSGSDLGSWLAARRISVLSTVPSLAALLDPEALAGVRLVILGGEACPDQLGWRLASDGREVWNTYGPTEATVVSAAAPVIPGARIVIGQPIAGVHAAVVDGDGRVVPAGQAGELVITGVGLGRYLDAALDRARFAPLPALGWARAYRTGDQVRLLPEGLEFLGRTDDQVKLAGRRVELAEVDRHLAAAPGVRAAAAAVRKTPAGNSILVGYVTGPADPDEVRRFVADRLPDGVVPTVVVLDHLPTTTAGKVDRDALAWPPPTEVGTCEHPLNGTEAWLAAHWAEQLGPVPMDAQSDFFELGGTSMAAAKLVSALRARFPAVAVADVYEHRRLGALAEHLDRLALVNQKPTVSLAHGRRFAALQLLGVGALFVLDGLGWVLGVLAVDQLLGVGLRIGWVPLILAWLVLGTAPGNALVVIGCRRLLLGNLSPGRYPRDGWMAWRIWIVERLADRHHLDELEGTPMAPRYARLLGIPVGRGASLDTLPSPACLVSIGAGATLEADVDLHGWWVEGGELVVGTIEIGPGARVGTRAVLMPGARVGADAEIEAGSVVTGTVPAGERWSGTPARPDGASGQGWPQRRDPAPPSRWWSVAYLAGMALVSVLPLAAAVPGLVVLERLGGFDSWQQAVRVALEWSPLLAAVFLASYALVVGLGCRWVARLITLGWHPTASWTAWALWVHGSLLEATHVVLFPLYSTVYTRGWLRLLGVRVGRRSEVSTAVGLVPLIEVGETSFLTDDVVFACSRAGWGWLEVRPSVVGSRSFVGNSAILRPSTRLGDDTLVGVLSIPPRHSPPGTSWLGAPSFELPRVVEPADPKRTTDPPTHLVVARGLTEVIRILLPATISLGLGALVLAALELLAASAGWVGLVAGAPAAVAMAAITAAALTVVAKWVVIGRYVPGQHPLWSGFVWRDEIVNSLHEQLAGAWLLTTALATPVMTAYLRAMGARVGRDTWVETLSVTEFDLVDLGPGCAVNRGACIETHLFHDRLMRLGPARLGAGVTLGPHAVVLLDSEVGPAASVGARSVVLRAERLPASTRWLGVPVRVA
jgi:non-ribosomal peptide synthetase-like protein